MATDSEKITITLHLAGARAEVSFTKASEAVIGDEVGVAPFNFGSIYPNVGDLLEFRFKPSDRCLTFRCIERRFDFASGQGSRVYFLCDIDHP